MHLIALHESAGSNNPLGVSGNYDRLPFAPYFIFKDLITIFLFIVVLSIFVFFMPNVLGDSENYVMANPMQTPPAIVPEWYLLPFYAILRSIPNKLLGVIAMFSAILILLTMPFTDLGRSRGLQFRPLSKIAFFVFVANFLILMQLGAKHVESPFIEFGQISTVLYFSHFLIIVPLVSLLENSLIELEFTNKKGSAKPWRRGIVNNINTKVLSFFYSLDIFSLIKKVFVLVFIIVIIYIFFELFIASNILYCMDGFILEQDRLTQKLDTAKDNVNNLRNKLTDLRIEQRHLLLEKTSMPERVYKTSKFMLKNSLENANHELIIQEKEVNAYKELLAENSRKMDLFKQSAVEVIPKKDA